VSEADLSRGRGSPVASPRGSSPTREARGEGAASRSARADGEGSSGEASAARARAHETEALRARDVGAGAPRRSPGVAGPDGVRRSSAPGVVVLRLRRARLDRVSVDAVLDVSRSRSASVDPNADLPRADPRREDYSWIVGTVVESRPRYLNQSRTYLRNQRGRSRVKLSPSSATS